MFEPKIYKKNGLEAFRLVGSDGSEFFYEGALDCNEKELYKDPLGRLYYPVIAEIGGSVKYYVELDPQVSPIPFVEPDARKTSRLINASPRPESELPEDIFVKPEALQEPPRESPLESLQEPLPAEPVPVVTPPEPAADLPLPVQEEHVKSQEASSAIQAVFSPKVDILHPPVEETGSAGLPEAKKEEPASPAKAPVKAPAKASKKRSLKWPFAIGIIVVILLASVAGAYVVKPQAFDGLRSMFKGPSPAPSPTPEPTVTPVPTAEPTVFPDAGTPSASISELIDSDSSEVAAFAQAHINATSTDSLRQACDLFDYVNRQWQYSDVYPTSRKASDITSQMEGTSRDYTVLMTALLQSQNITSRVVFSYTAGSDIPRYYPEVLAATTPSQYNNVSSQLASWYGISSPQGHRDEAGDWISLSMGGNPGIRPSDATDEFTLYGGKISPLR